MFILLLVPLWNETNGDNNIDDRFEEIILDSEEASTAIEELPYEETAEYKAHQVARTQRQDEIFDTVVGFGKGGLMGLGVVAVLAIVSYTVVKIGKELFQYKKEYHPIKLDKNDPLDASLLALPVPKRYLSRRYDVTIAKRFRRFSRAHVDKVEDVPSLEMIEEMMAHAKLDDPTYPLGNQVTGKSITKSTNTSIPNISFTYAPLYVNKEDMTPIDAYYLFRQVLLYCIYTLKQSPNEELKDAVYVHISDRKRAHTISLFINLLNDDRFEAPTHSLSTLKADYLQQFTDRLVDYAVTTIHVLNETTDQIEFQKEAKFVDEIKALDEASFEDLSPVDLDSYYATNDDKYKIEPDKRMFENDPN